jgi:hypothetical protein
MQVEAVSSVSFPPLSAAVPPRDAALAQAHSQAQAPPAAEAPAAEAASGQRVAYPNPASRLDPALNMVILEFRDPSGKITESLPTAQQLDQFRQNMAAATPKSVWT